MSAEMAARNEAGGVAIIGLPRVVLLAFDPALHRAFSAATVGLLTSVVLHFSSARAFIPRSISA
jgi:hypothetical protein